MTPSCAQETHLDSVGEDVHPVLVAGGVDAVPVQPTGGKGGRVGTELDVQVQRRSRMGSRCCVPGNSCRRTCEEKRREQEMVNWGGLSDFIKYVLIIIIIVSYSSNPGDLIREPGSHHIIMGGHLMALM